MTNKAAPKGIVLPLILVIVVILLGGGFYLYYRGLINIPFLNKVVPTLSTDGSVALKSEYKNPFDASTQYVNPFSEWKNPFDTIK